MAYFVRSNMQFVENNDKFYVTLLLFIMVKLLKWKSIFLRDNLNDGLTANRDTFIWAHNCIIVKNQGHRSNLTRTIKIRSVRLYLKNQMLKCSVKFVKSIALRTN